MESSPQSPASKIEAAHQLYRDGKHEAALGFYTEALAAAKTKPQRIALHSNRAACYLKLHDFKKAAEECTSVLELDHDHTGALMLRAQTLVTLKDYHSALFDVNRLMELNPSSEAYQNLETRLRTQLSLAPIPESEAELEEEEEEEDDEDDESEAGEEYEDDEVVQTSKHELDRTTVYAEEGIKQPSSNGSGDQKPEARKSITAEVIAQVQRKPEPRRTIASEVIAQAQRTSKASAEQQQQQQSKGWQAIPKPKGHSALDYARWDRVVQDDSSDEDDDDDDDDDDEEESRPQYRFRVRTVGVQPVK